MGMGNPKKGNPFSYVCDRGNHHRGIRKETLCRLGLQVEIIECVGKVPSNYHGSLYSLRMRVSSLECVDMAPYYLGFHDDHHENPLLTKETKSKPIWDIGVMEEEYPFVNKYLSFQENPIMLVEEESCPVYDTDNEEDAKPAPKYDSGGDELMYKDEEVCLPDVENVCNMIIDGGRCENVVSTHKVQKLGLKEEDHPKPLQLTWLKKGNVIKVSKRCFVQFSIGRKYKEDVWCEVIPMEACHILLGFKTIKVRSSDYNEREFDAGDTNLDATSTSDELIKVLGRKDEENGRYLKEKEEIIKELFYCDLEFIMGGS
nr:reverse transcriptase domain-containing protein [Tanacetum cinerariifolium]